MRKGLISIIVPIYNRENNIKRCIESILEQDYKNIEVILVNDGSTDSTLDICNSYKELDKRVVVVDKKNGGVSSARNDGIKKSSGEFIQFVDSDDYIDKNMCSTLIRKIKEDDADVVICGYKKINKNNEEIIQCKSKISKNGIYGLRDEFSILYEKFLINPPWNKLYKKNAITNYFETDISLGEDLIFNISNISNIKKISIINNALYNYVQDTANSLTSINSNHDRIYIAIKIYREINKILDIHGIEPEYRKAVNNILIKDTIDYFQALVLNKNIRYNEKLNKINSCVNLDYVQMASKKAERLTLQNKIINIFIYRKNSKMIYMLISGKIILKKIIANFYLK